MPVKTKINKSLKIVSNPEIRGGKPCIAGTRISVHNIAIYYNAGLPIDEIVESFAGINHQQVFSALAYYYEHKAEIDKMIQQDEIDIENYRKTHEEEHKEFSRHIKKRAREMGLL